MSRRVRSRGGGEQGQGNVFGGKKNSNCNAKTKRDRKGGIEEWGVEAGADCYLLGRKSVLPYSASCSIEHKSHSGLPFHETSCGLGRHSLSVQSWRHASEQSGEGLRGRAFPDPAVANRLGQLAATQSTGTVI